MPSIQARKAAMAAGFGQPSLPLLAPTSAIWMIFTASSFVLILRYVDKVSYRNSYDCVASTVPQCQRDRDSHTNSEGNERIRGAGRRCL